jgi:uncharacterized protein (TIGR03435 family)
LPGGQYVDSRTNLLFMLAFAYDMRNMNLSVQLVGLPNWAKDQSYSVAAKPAEDFPQLPPGENQEQVRLMMRAMLADPFHLQVHTEARQEPIFNLRVASGGIKIKEVDPPVPPAKAGNVGAAMGDRSGQMIGNKSTMAGLASALGIFLQRPVVDQTGLQGYYAFDIRWNSAETSGGQTASSGFGTDGTALLISNLQDQFGLRLTKTTGPVQYWVVDHVEPPSAN